jgi:hypothetical protein
VTKMATTSDEEINDYQIAQAMEEMGGFDEPEEEIHPNEEPFGDRPTWVRQYFAGTLPLDHPVFEANDRMADNYNYSGLAGLRVG